MQRWVWFILSAALAVAAPSRIKVRITWGHQAPQAAPYYLRLVPANGASIENAAGYSLEPGEGQSEDAWQSRAGAGDIDGVDLTLVDPGEPAAALQNLHIIWADLIANSDPDTARRLGRDPAFRPGSPRLTVRMNPEGTRGFTVTTDQLREEKALWIPSLRVYVAAGEQPVAFADHRKQLAAWQGRRVLDRVRRDPEATYEQYKARWADMGDVAYTHPQQRGPGHIVCLTWDSAIPKFGIDRRAGVWNDYGNADRFQFWFELADSTAGIDRVWRGQSLHDGLPVITTKFEREGVSYEVEQFAYPLNGPPAERRGDIPMVLLQRVKAIELAGTARRISIAMAHRRQFPKEFSGQLVRQDRGGAVLFVDTSQQRALFAIQGAGEVRSTGVRDYQREQRRLDATVFEPLPARGTRQFVVKLPSATVGPDDQDTLLALDYDAARAATLKFWTGYLERGAQFRVPEKAVNDLVRTTLWHALRLPRRHGGQGEEVPIDLPYSNFAYSQTGTPWPVNQAVYVDYMLYDLRGYHSISFEELRAQFRNNQEASGHLKGVANWVVYTPGMLYAVAQHYLLSHDRKSLEALLPYALKSLDWCLEEIRRAADRPGAARGLVLGPLNDGTGEGVWAFNQAYMYAGLSLFGQVLEEIGHPRAQQALEAGRAIRRDIARGFGAAAASSPLVQLRDHTWIPYVPCEALTHGRILDQWYPTDVDTGAVHLVRLGALSPRDELADSLLNDHEDNLFLKGWGLANEPVYNQQATAYLLRDDPKAAIRAFYSYMASAFSHSVLEPVEHRWTHGQYFGPPSTDGAFFELLRNMLVHEGENETLVLGLATPRKWLEDGKKIEVRQAPTWYGRLSLLIESRAASGQIRATIEPPDRRNPRLLLLRLRHPQAKGIRSVTVNGKTWTDFDPRREWLRLPNPEQRRYEVVADY
ncbi:MAG: hypothetical protein AAB225_00250 [Acidobacteriota bacterium]